MKNYIKILAPVALFMLDCTKKVAQSYNVLLVSLSALQIIRQLPSEKIPLYWYGVLLRMYVSNTRWRSAGQKIELKSNKMFAIW